VHFQKRDFENVSIQMYKNKFYYTQPVGLTIFVEYFTYTEHIGG